MHSQLFWCKSRQDINPKSQQRVLTIHIESITDPVFLMQDQPLKRKSSRSSLKEKENELETDNRNDVETHAEYNNRAHLSLHVEEPVLQHCMLTPNSRRASFIHDKKY